MPNFNPKSPDVLPAACPDPADAFRLRDLLAGAAARTEARVIDVEIGSRPHVYVVRLVTDCENLARFWTLNFSPHHGHCPPDGIIWFLDDAGDPAATAFHRQRHYLPEIEQIVCFNNDFYRNLKMSYRGLTADLALRDGLVSLHSAAVSVDGKAVVITGDSGAGKSTLLKHILNDLGGTLVWDDWGFVDTRTLALCDPQEDYNHMKLSSLLDLVPDFADASRCHTEFHDQESRFPENARIMVRLADYLPSIPRGQDQPLTLDTLVILKNDRHQGHTIEEIDPATALGVFFTPVQSRAFGYEIRCFNGSLLLAGGLAQRHRELNQRLFDRIESILLINNNYSGMDYDRLDTLLTRNHQPTSLRNRSNHERYPCGAS
jgi:hypothetical protein